MLDYSTWLTSCYNQKTTLTFPLNGSTIQIQSWQEKGFLSDLQCRFIHSFSQVVNNYLKLSRAEVSRTTMIRSNCNTLTLRKKPHIWLPPCCVSRINFSLLIAHRESFMIALHIHAVQRKKTKTNDVGTHARSSTCQELTTCTCNH